MKTFTLHDTKWHLVDEGLLDVIGDGPGRKEARRGYSTHPYGDGAVFIKYFREKGIQGFVRNRVSPRGKREFLTGRKLLSFPVPTPAPLGYGISPEGSYIIQEWLEGASLSLMLKEGDRKSLLGDLADLLRMLKDHHARHNDLHLDNIIVAGGRLYLIDLHKMRIKKFFGLGDEVSNLSHALVSLYRDMDEEEKTAFFDRYGSDRARIPLESEIEKLTARWFRKKRERAFEETSRIVPEGNRLYAAGMEGSGTGGFVETIKRDRKVRVERFSDHVRKIYRDKRRLRKAWKAHVVFLYMDLPAVPAPYYLALPAKGEAGYIAMEDLKGKGEEMDRYLDGNYGTMDYGERKRFIDRLCLFLDGLLKWGIMHHDMKGCNLFVLGTDGFTLLDVEDITFGSLNSQDIERMFFQLNTTLPRKILMRDRMRFFLRITSSLGLDRKSLFRKLLWKSAGKEIVYEGRSGLMRESW